jgi:chemotaxis protein MotA
MDITTAIGLLAGAIVTVSLIMMGGDVRMFLDVHAFIVIFGGAFAATLIRFRSPPSCTDCRWVRSTPSRSDG